jgi:hypothetical protein
MDEIEGTQIIDSIKPVPHNYKFVKRTVIRDYSVSESVVEKFYEQSEFSKV